MGNKEIFERMASGYDTESRVRDADIISNEIRKELKDAQGKRALDYGCGTGLVGLALVGSFGSMVLMDASEQMIKQVEKKIAGSGVSNARAICCDLSTDDVPPGMEFDYILMSQVLLHVNDYPALLKRLFRILADDGHLIIVDFDKNEKIVSDMVHNGFVHEELTSLLEGIGFASVDVRTFHHGTRMFMNEDASLFILHAIR